MHPAASRGGIGLDELAGMDVIHGPRRVSPGTYDTLLAAVRTRNPHFEFTDLPFPRSLPMTRTLPGRQRYRSTAGGQADQPLAPRIESRAFLAFCYGRG